MAQWRFIITPEAESDIRRLDAPVRRRVLEKLKWFVENFNDVTPFPLDNPWKGFFKLRVGDWRIIYEVETSKNLVTVHLIDRRDKVYKR